MRQRENDSSPSADQPAIDGHSQPRALMPRASVQHRTHPHIYHPAYSSFIYFMLWMHLCVCFHVFVPVQDRMGCTVHLNMEIKQIKGIINWYSESVQPLSQPLSWKNKLLIFNNLFKTNCIFLINVGFISSIIFRLIFHI